MTATWGEHEPAYYVATHSEKKEVVLAIRGTWAVEDVVTDITALPVVPTHPPPPAPPSCPRGFLAITLLQSLFTTPPSNITVLPVVPPQLISSPLQTNCHSQHATTPCCLTS